MSCQDMVTLMYSCRTLHMFLRNGKNAPKELDDFSKGLTNVNYIDISYNLSQIIIEDPQKVCKLTIGDATEAYFTNDVAYFVSPNAEATYP